MIRLIACIITLGLYCTLGKYSYDKYGPSPIQKAHAVAKPVVIASRCDDTDWLCLIAWAAEEHPPKHKRRKS